MCQNSRSAEADSANNGLLQAITAQNMPVTKSPEHRAFIVKIAHARCFNPDPGGTKIGPRWEAIAQD